MEKIRVLVGILGLDQHEVGAVAVARMLRDAGMEVLYTGKFNLPETIVRTCVEEDIDVVGLSCHSWEYLYYIPELIELMKDNHLDIPIVVGGSVLTSGDEEKLADLGVTACFGSGSTEQAIVESVRALTCKTS